MSETKPLTEVFVCTKDNKWDRTKDHPRILVQHVDTIDDGECSEGCCDFLRCIHCDTRIRIEVAE